MHRYQPENPLIVQSDRSVLLEVDELPIEKQLLTRSNNQLRGNESNMKTYSFDYVKACKILNNNKNLRIPRNKNYKKNQYPYY